MEGYRKDDQPPPNDLPPKWQLDDKPWKTVAILALLLLALAAKSYASGSNLIGFVIAAALIFSVILYGWLAGRSPR